MVVLRILFLCVANSARSQIGEGVCNYLARLYSGSATSSVICASAGSKPSGKVHPLAMQVVKELDKDADLSKHYSKSIQTLPDAFISNLTHIITLCAEEDVCPRLNPGVKLPPSVQQLHWPLPDPASHAPADADSFTDSAIGVFRSTRDSIQTALLTLLRDANTVHESDCMCCMDDTQEGGRGGGEVLELDKDSSELKSGDAYEAVDAHEDDHKEILNGSKSGVRQRRMDRKQCIPGCPACCHAFDHPNCSALKCKHADAVHTHGEIDFKQDYVQLHLDDAIFVTDQGVSLDHTTNASSIPTTVTASPTTSVSSSASPSLPLAPGSEAPSLSFVDRYLTIWILLSMLLGVLIGYYTSASTVINNWTLGGGGTNVPIAVGLIVMLYPPFARVDYAKIGAMMSTAIGRTHINAASPVSSSYFRMISVSLVLNWLVGPLLMFVLALACLPDHPTYIQGLVIVGVARCIAMVLVWNRLSHGNSEFATLLVCLNSLFQLVLYSPLVYLFASILLPSVLPSASASSDVSVSFSLVAESVAIYLLIPFSLGFLSWLVLPRVFSSDWYHHKFITTTAPLTLIALLFTIIVMFALRAQTIISLPLDILRICVPLLVYFVCMFLVSLLLSSHFGFAWDHGIALSFTAASNNFELAIAVCIAVFGVNSDQALAAVVGPLVEVPVMLAFVHVTRAFAKRSQTIATP